VEPLTSYTHTNHAPRGPLCENMTSSRKPEVHNVSTREESSHDTGNIRAKNGEVRQCGSWDIIGYRHTPQTDRQTDRQTRSSQ